MTNTDVKIVIAKGIYNWILIKFDKNPKNDFGAMVTPWKTIHIMEHRKDDAKLIEHEMVHIDQINRLGSLRWTIMYLWYQLRYGYDENPFEIEAREKSGVR